MSAQAGAEQPIVIAGRTFRRPAIQNTRINWMWVGFFIMLVVYWVFVIRLERIDSTVVLARWLYSDMTADQIASTPFVWLLRFVVRRSIREYCATSSPFLSDGGCRWKQRPVWSRCCTIAPIGRRPATFCVASADADALLRELLFR
ncbi:MAG: hypothetical protein R3C44_01290 [Chloroflexota bacterium]